MDEVAYRQLYYQIHREEILRKTKEREKRNYEASANYRRLVYLRKKRANYRQYIKKYQDRIKFFRKKLDRIHRPIEEMELAWGAERAAMKRAAKVATATR